MIQIKFGAAQPVAEKNNANDKVSQTQFKPKIVRRMNCSLVAVQLKNLFRRLPKEGRQPANLPLFIDAGNATGSFNNY